MTGTMVPTKLRALMKLSLERTHTISLALEDPIVADPNDPRIRKLLEHLYFSRSFIPTYYAVLIAALLVCAVVKRWNHLRRDNRSTNARRSAALPTASSSSSSTLRGSNTPVAKDASSTETMPLLFEDKLHQLPQQSDLGRLWCAVQAFLMYQPAPIPAMTSSKNTLPPNETTLIILNFLALNLFYFFFRLPLTKDMLFIVADRAGLVFVVNLPVLYVLAAKNNQPFKWLTGCSYEGLNLFHRRLGEWMTIAALIHAVAMFVIYWLIFKPIGLSLAWYVTRPLVLLGICGFGLYLFIYFTSIGYFRQKRYETFLLVHITFQVAALVVVFFHHPGARPYVGAALGIWSLDRLVWRLFVKKTSFIATLQIAADGETVSMSIMIPLRENTFARQDVSAGWYAGQHIFVTVPGLGLWHLLQAHPFTIASPAPPSKGRPAEWPLHLAIRAQDGFSRELLEFAQHHQHARVYVDGPYSSRHVLESLQSSDRVCLIAGGSGIAVTFPFAAAMHQDVSEDNLVSTRTEYIGGSRKQPNFALSDSPLERSNFGHMWVRQSSKHESWIMAWPGASACSTIPEPRGEQERALDIVTHRFETRSPTLHQRPDMVAELTEWVRGDAKTGFDPNESICIVVSGPDALVREVRNTASSLVREGRKVEVHVEKFGW